MCLLLAGCGQKGALYLPAAPAAPASAASSGSR
ncbi:MAG: lipoprotein [Rubrivivax sp.]|nr:lipoprotein [Rubrivivax sp.]